MLTAFLTVFEQMFRILMLIGGGFLLHKLHLLPEGAEKVMSRLVTYLFLPAVLLHTNLLECRVLTLGENLPLVLCGLIMALVSIGAAMLLAPAFARGSLYDRGVFRYAIAYPNTGGVGMSLVLAMFGTKGLFQYNLFYFFALIFNYSWGIMQLQPAHERRGAADILRRLANPALIGLLLGMALGVLGAGEWLPGIVIDTAGDLGECYVPVSLLLVGYTVADFPLGRVLGDIRAYIFSVLRLLVLPVLFMVVLRLVRAPQIMSVMAALAFACPCGMNTVLYPVSYGQECRAGVSMVLVSSVLSVLTLPLVYALTAL